MSLFWNLDEIMYVNHSEHNVPKFSNSNRGTGATSLCWQESHWTPLHVPGTLKPEDKGQWRQHVTFLVCACDSPLKALLTCFWIWDRHHTDHSWVWLIHEVWSGFEGRQEWPLGSCSKFFHFGLLPKQMKAAQGKEMRQGYIWWWLLFLLASRVNS